MDTLFCESYHGPAENERTMCSLSLCSTRTTMIPLRKRKGKKKGINVKGKERTTDASFLFSVPLWFLFICFATVVLLSLDVFCIFIFLFVFKSFNFAFKCFQWVNCPESLVARQPIYLINLLWWLRGRESVHVYQYLGKAKQGTGTSKKGTIPQRKLKQVLVDWSTQEHSEFSFPV